MRKVSLITLLMCSAACNNYGYSNSNGALWDTNVAAANDGIYINLPVAGELIRVNTSGVSLVDLDGAIPTNLVPSPDGSQVLVFAEWQECKDDSKDIKTIGDCQDDLVTHSVLEIVADAKVRTEVSIPSHLNQISFSDDGSIVVAYLDYESGSDITVTGFADLGEVAFIRLAD